MQTFDLERVEWNKLNTHRVSEPIADFDEDDEDDEDAGITPDSDDVDDFYLGDEDDDL